MRGSLSFYYSNIATRVKHFPSLPIICSGQSCFRSFLSRQHTRQHPGCQLRYCHRAWCINLLGMSRGNDEPRAAQGNDNSVAGFSAPAGNNLHPRGSSTCSGNPPTRLLLIYFFTSPLGMKYARIMNNVWHHGNLLTEVLGLNIPWNKDLPVAHFQWSCYEIFPWTSSRFTVTSAKCRYFFSVNKVFF